MQVIPSVNVPDFERAQELFIGACEFLPAGAWIHIDVADGLFTPNATWRNADEFKSLKLHTIKTEVHCMVEDIPAHLLAWAGAGIQRAIVHVEALDPVRNPPRQRQGGSRPWRLISNGIEYIVEICARHGVKLGLAIAPETPVEELSVYFNTINFYQILAVPPGTPGQRFDERAIEKIKFLRTAAPHAILEVDGGITPDTARRAKTAGADIVVSASYIFDRKNSRAAYEELAIV